MRPIYDILPTEHFFQIFHHIGVIDGLLGLGGALVDCLGIQSTTRHVPALDQSIVAVITILYLEGCIFTDSIRSKSLY